MQQRAVIELGPYQLVEKIGEGGSGQVYRAHGPAGTVAVKVLAPASELDEAARARFFREIAALGQLVHPNLVRLLDHGIDAELGPYLVLPLLPGSNLRALCGGRAICPEAALLLVQPIAHATAVFHAANYVHRDLKPENAIAAPDGSIIVIDLGLAWRDGMTRHTDTGAAVGSVGYMSPEQIEGRPVNGRADVWALGAILYEMIAGKRPFARVRPAEEAAAALLGACPRLTAVDRRASEEVAELVARCLALDPDRRPSAAELAAAIDALVDWSPSPLAAERAAVIADPVAYQSRIAPFRIRRLERLAREAIDAGAPFAALAYCDRGLAYAPEDPGLLAVVTAAESATAAKLPSTTPSATVLARSRRWLWIGLGAVLAVVGAAVMAPSSSAPAANDSDPWGPNQTHLATSDPSTGAVQVKLVPDERDRKLMMDFVSVFGRAVAHGPSHSNAMTESDRELAGDVVGLLGTMVERLPAAPAPDAQATRCLELVAAKDAGARAACESALQRKPGDSMLLGARGRARTAAGNHAGAKQDLDEACRLGNATACHDEP